MRALAMRFRGVLRGGSADKLEDWIRRRQATYRCVDQDRLSLCLFDKAGDEAHGVLEWDGGLPDEARDRLPEGKR